jgi:hypothetical protein
MSTQPLRVLQKFWKPGSIRVLSLVILVTLLFFGAWFYMYVAQNYSYLVERNFRLLATWGTELTETVENYERSFRFRVQEQESAGFAEPSSLIRSRGIGQTLTDKGLVLEGFTPIAEAGYAPRDKPNYKLMLEQQTREQLRLLPFSYEQKMEPPSPPPGRTSPKPKADPPTVTFSYSPPPRLALCLEIC